MVHSRRLRRALLGLSAAFWASTALAQTSTSVTTSTTSGLAASDFSPIVLKRPDGNTWVPLATADAALYFNQARCLCPEEKVHILVQMVSSSISKIASLATTGANARLYVGYNCGQLNASGTGPQCPDGLLGSLNGLSGLSGWELETTVRQIFAGAGESCDGNTAPLSTALWLWVDTTGKNHPDDGVNGASAPSLGIKLDAQAPPAPSGVKVEGGSEALEVSWNTEATDNPDLAGYLVFCARGEDLAVFNPSFYDYTHQTPYQTSQILCQAAAPVPVTSLTSSTAAGDTTATQVTAPAFFQSPDPKYLCSNRLSPSQTNTRIRILQNGIPYTAGVAAVDTSGNISPIMSGFVQRPVPTVDFYRAYRDAGGESPGGYCSVVDRGRPRLLAWLAGTGLVAALLFRRRRRRRAGHTRGLLVLLALLTAPPAQAQVVSDEIDDDQSVEEHQSFHTPKHWAFELRFGPYAPNVDSEFSDSTHATPYKTVFGGNRHLMSQLELDWQIFQAFGSLSVGAVIGYYSQSAKAFIADSTTGLSTGEQSGDTTSLRLIPTAALLVYRWDVAADRWSIPLVPYGKLGLNYTFWHVTDGNGNVPHYLGGQGSGGTPGWQAAAGMSLMLDFLDPTTARLLDQETGVNHTYLFFEWNRVDATGLGLSNKLHVGDSRWVLGMMFEF